MLTSAQCREIGDKFHQLGDHIDGRNQHQLGAMGGGLKGSFDFKGFIAFLLQSIPQILALFSGTGPAPSPIPGPTDPNDENFDPAAAVPGSAPTV